MRLFNFLFTLSLMLLSGATLAQSSTTNETNIIDSFYTSGKIYVVVTGILVVLFILLFYLVRIDRKLTRLEKEQKES